MEEYLRKLVDFYPVSANQKSVADLLEYARREFERVGLKTETLTYGGIHNLYVSTSGNKHTKLLLQAHVDVVPGPGQSFKATEDSYEGRGTFDMLFAAAAYLKLVSELGDKLHELNLGIFLSGDEELSGEYGVKTFLGNGYSCDVCILPDAGDGYGTLSVGAKGVLEIKVRIHGKAHHGSRPWEGDGAAIKLAHFLTEAEKLFDTSDRANTTMTVAILAAGDVANRGPAIADATLDIRYKDKADLERVQASINGLLQKYNGEIVETLEGDEYQLDLTNPLVKQFMDLYQQQLGHEVKQMIAPGSSDARFFTKYNIPVIMWRPDGGGAHGDNEWVSRENTEQFYNLLKEYVHTVA